MSKEIEEAREHKKHKQRVEARVSALSEELQGEGLAYCLVVLDPAHSISAFSAWGQTQVLAEGLTIMTANVTRMMSHEIREKNRQLKGAGRVEPTWEDNE